MTVIHRWFGEVKSRLRRAMRSATRTKLFARLLIIHESALAAAIRAPRRSAPAPQYTLALLVSDGHGNIGDQAMIEAVCAATPGPVLLLADSAGAVRTSSALSDATVSVVPGVVGRWRPLSVRRMRAFHRAVGEASSFAVIGADVMDGVYSPVASVLRASYLMIAARRGRPSRVLGFSWSTAATPGATWALQRASRAVEILPRDPRSEARLREAGVLTQRHVADVVFSATSAAPIDSLSELAATPFAIVNASGLIARTGTEFIHEYDLIIRELESAGLTIVLLPHVLRDGDSDLNTLRRLTSALPHKVELVTDELSPMQVRWLAARARVIVTGRMHLAIMGLNMGTPTITLSTVGKVEGLYEMIGLPQLAIEPTPGYGERVAGSVRECLSNSEHVRSAIGAALPYIRELSDQNFEIAARSAR